MGSAPERRTEFDPLVAAVTVHRFSAVEGESETLATELTGFFEDLRAELYGLQHAIVLIGYGVGAVAVIAGWESPAAQVDGVASLRTDPRLAAIASRSGVAEHDEYRVVSVLAEPARPRQDAHA